MASLQKINITRYVDRAGNRVAKGTKGAKKVKEESSKWYCCYRIGRKQVRIPLATDKEASQVMMADHLRQRERGQAGMVDPYKVHLDRSIVEHVADYLAVVKATTRSVQYQKDVARILGLFIDGSGAKTLREVTPDRVSRYLASLKTGATARNYVRRVVVMLLNWCESVGRLDRNPVTKHTVKTARKDRRRLRRALPAEDILRLLDAVRAYPLKSASTNRGGRNARKNPAERQARLKPETVARLEQRGRERWLMYRLAILTGLRRIELSRLRVSHLELGQVPRINLPGHLTKNGKPARIMLVPSLAADLQQWITDTGKGPSDAVVRVPGTANLSRLHRSHLALAGVTYEVDGRFADFHSLRMSANVVLRKAGIPAKERQLFLRHGKLELTTETYDDESATEMAEVVKALADANL